MPFSNLKNSGPGYIVLNVVRACNIVCLLSCLGSSTVMLVKTFITNRFFFFFDATSHILTGVLSILLILTETSLFREHIQRNWPLLGIRSGFLTLGLLMIALGTLILGNLNKEATSEDALGTSCWQLVISSGIITTIFGVANIVANYLFRKRKEGITAREVRSYGATAPQRSAAIVGRTSRDMAAYDEWHEKAMVLPSHQQSYADLKRSGTGSTGHSGVYPTLGEATREPGMVAAPAPHPPQLPVGATINGPMRPISSIGSYYTDDKVSRCGSSVARSEGGAPNARRAVSPLSSNMSRADSQRTRFPVRSMSNPDGLNYKQYRFDDVEAAAEIRRPDQSAHPAYRNNMF